MISIQKRNTLGKRELGQLDSPEFNLVIQDQPSHIPRRRKRLEQQGIYESNYDQPVCAVPGMTACPIMGYKQRTWEVSRYTLLAGFAFLFADSAAAPHVVYRSE